MKKYKDEHIEIYWRDKGFWEVFFASDQEVHLESIKKVFGILSTESGNHPLLIHSEAILNVQMPSMSFVSVEEHPIFSRLHVLVTDHQGVSKESSEQLLAMKKAGRRIEAYSSLDEALMSIYSEIEKL